MAEKLTMNANFICKSDGIAPQKCVVEKVIKVYDTEFKGFLENPMKRNYYLSSYKELMGFYDDAYHGVLFVNKNSGDGLLVNSEGADYARYSQFIPNARDIVQKHEQTQAMKEFEKHLKSWIWDCVSDAFEKPEFEVSFEKFCNAPHTREKLRECLCAALNARPEISCVNNVGDKIIAEKKNITEMKLYCPLKILSGSDDYSDDCCEELPENYIYYAAQINAAIHRDIMSDADMQTRGLIAYTDNNHLYHKVHSVFPQVESRDGNLYGVITVKSYGELDKSELLDLTNEIRGQLSDGWGEGFEQREIRLGNEDVYISFWNSDDDYFLKPESEVFPDQAHEHTMGGI